MRTAILPLIALSLAACSSTSTQPQEIEAVRDFVASTELTEVDEIRHYRNVNYRYINDRFVTVPTRRGDYLVELQRNCYELRQNNFEPGMIDERESADVIRARTDTIRGCRIAKMYEITEAQAEELKALGDAPGDEIFLKDK